MGTEPFFAVNWVVQGYTVGLIVRIGGVIFTFLVGIAIFNIGAIAGQGWCAIHNGNQRNGLKERASRASYVAQSVC